MALVRLTPAGETSADDALARAVPTTIYVDVAQDGRRSFLCWGHMLRGPLLLATVVASSLAEMVETCTRHLEMMVDNSVHL